VTCGSIVREADEFTVRPVIVTLNAKVTDTVRARRLPAGAVFSTVTFTENVSPAQYVPLPVEGVYAMLSTVRIARALIVTLNRLPADVTAAPVPVGIDVLLGNSCMPDAVAVIVTASDVGAAATRRPM
jgi:hypothetical protein